MDYYHQLKKLSHNFTTFIPFNGFSKELKKELELFAVPILFENDKIILAGTTDQATCHTFIWAQDQWANCNIKEFSSTHEAIKEIKKWDFLSCYYSSEKNEFGKKISQQVRQLPVKRIKYQISHDFKFNFYSWTSLGNFIVFSKQQKQRFPFGLHEFEENKEFPPNRAYLKLWEIFSVYGFHPDPKDVALEIGASPGGWSWVLSQICKQVYTIDRAPLDKKISAIPNIKHIEGDAFKLPPEDYSDCTWFFSDIICAPEKLYNTVQQWLTHSTIENYICTIKFKGDCDFDIIKQFLEISHSKIIHLYHNKNEVTWLRSPQLVK